MQLMSQKRLGHSYVKPSSTIVNSKKGEKTTQVRSHHFRNHRVHNNSPSNLMNINKKNQVKGLDIFENVSYALVNGGIASFFVNIFILILLSVHHQIILKRTISYMVELKDNSIAPKVVNPSSNIKFHLTTSKAKSIVRRF